MNSNIVDLIPNIDKPESWDDFKPIALCNLVYKIISNIIVKRLRCSLFKGMRKEKFGFLDG